jgi:hypothetical protein
MHVMQIYAALQKPDEYFYYIMKINALELIKFIKEVKKMIVALLLN